MCRRTFRKSFSILFRARFDVSPPDICWRRFFVFFLKTKQNKTNKKKMLGQLFSTEYHLLIATEPLMEVWYLLITEKFLLINFVGGGGGGGRWGWIPSFFKTESWWKDDIYWSLKSSCFELFRNEKCGLYLRQNVDGKMIFTGYWKVLIFSFSVIGNTVSILAKKSF